jgi:CMP-N,N'-diacetyllegionaminic acid synthase
MNLLITICARGGSKGIPKKNIKIINGKPLINYTVRTAENFKNSFKAADVDIVLSTEDAEIKKVVEDFSFQIDTRYTRPLNKATDDFGKIDVIKDVLYYMEAQYKKQYEIILDLDVTSPLRNLTDLYNSLDLLIKKPEAYNIFSVSPANKNPYFNMVEERVDGYMSLCKHGKFFSRQTAPKVYEMNASFYFYRRRFFEQNHSTVITDKSLMYLMPHLCFDLDHAIDFEFMSFLLVHHKLDFDL